MASAADDDYLEDEIQELLLNYKNKKSTIYEPCTLKNYKECLFGLREELEAFNINYMYNPYQDVVNSETLTPEALVRLINATFSLLHHLKNTKNKADRLTEINVSLENTNKKLNEINDKLKNKVNEEKNETKSYLAALHRVTEHSTTVANTLGNTNKKLVQANKHTENKEKSLKNEISRLKMENEKLQMRLMKNGGGHSCTGACDASARQLRERLTSQTAVAAALQDNNRRLLEQLLALKEELLLSGLSIHDD